MKYIIILGDGMADEPIESLGGKTPLEVAKKPNIDSLVQKGEIGLVKTIPEGFSPGSDTANLSVLGYDPRKYYTGRSPLEAISMGINMKEKDVSFRCNLVTLAEGETNDYSDMTIIDHSADEITTKEAEELIKAVSNVLSTEHIKFYTGISYRHALIWDNGSTNVELTPPHDILTKKINNYLPKGDNADIITKLMMKSYEILKDHPINIKRKNKGLNPANSIWIWGEGTKPILPSFEDKYGLKGSMISAVDLLKGIAKASSMKDISVEGATGNINTNYEGKARACIKAIEEGSDFVYVHLEAPDECGHRGELENKIKSIELIDKKIVEPIVESLKNKNIDFRMLILPDHPTPLNLRTHTNKPVPYVLYDSTLEKNSNNSSYNEVAGSNSNKLFEHGYLLMDYFLKK